MKIIVADFIYTQKGFVANQALAFADIIEDIDNLKALIKKYPGATIIHTEANSILYPGFINTHVHLEFSANKTSLKYGSFMPWLDSVIEHREELMSACDNTMMTKQCEEMLRSGVTSFG
ncbi:MAG: metal-dependent hydrolase, partial [Epsilonproteobacteria bacterium]